MAVVVFDQAEFRQLYPQYKDSVKYSDVYLQGQFNEACLICNNTDSSRVPYDPNVGVTERKTLLYMLVCHLATIAENGVVGTVSQANQGSVSASFQLDNRKNAAWFMQTPCGYKYWQFTRKYRTGGMFVQGSVSH